jgi:hypothetical protein
MLKRLIMVAVLAVTTALGSDLQQQLRQSIIQDPRVDYRQLLGQMAMNQSVRKETMGTIVGAYTECFFNAMNGMMGKTPTALALRNAIPPVVENESEQNAIDTLRGNLYRFVTEVLNIPGALPNHLVRLTANAALKYLSLYGFGRSEPIVARRILALIAEIDAQPMIGVSIKLYDTGMRRQITELADQSNFLKKIYSGEECTDQVSVQSATSLRRDREETCLKLKKLKGHPVFGFFTPCTTPRIFSYGNTSSSIYSIEYDTAMFYLEWEKKKPIMNCKGGYRCSDWPGIYSGKDKQYEANIMVDVMEPKDIRELVMQCNETDVTRLLRDDDTLMEAFRRIADYQSKKRRWVTRDNPEAVQMMDDLYPKLKRILGEQLDGHELYVAFMDRSLMILRNIYGIDFKHWRSDALDVAMRQRVMNWDYSDSERKLVRKEVPDALKAFNHRTYCHIAKNNKVISMGKKGGPPFWTSLLNLAKLLGDIDADTDTYTGIPDEGRWNLLANLATGSKQTTPEGKIAAVRRSFIDGIEGMAKAKGSQKLTPSEEELVSIAWQVKLGMAVEEDDHRR